MNEIREIANLIEQYSVEIISNLERESIDVYQFLKEGFENSDVTQNYLFQFVFRSFYRIDNAGLTPEFKKEYFKIMEQNRNEKQFDFKRVFKRLYILPDRKGQNTLQFSFVTKLFSIIDNTLPVYDSKVAEMFSFSKPYQSDFDIKVERFLIQYEVIKRSYTEISNLNLIPKAGKLFDLSFANHGLTETKKLDFIFWSAGKLKKLEKLK